MPKLIYTFICLFFFLNSGITQSEPDIRLLRPSEILTQNPVEINSPNNEDFLLIATSSEDWQDNTAFVNVDSTALFYDEEERLQERILIDWIQEEWVNNKRELISYEDNGLKTITQTETWNGLDWITTIGDDRRTVVINEEEEALGILEERYDGNFWREAVRNTYTYDFITGYLTEILTEEAPINVLQNSFRILYDNHDTNGNAQMIQSELWVNEEWQPSTRIFSAYDSLSQLRSEIFQSYQIGEWVNIDKRDFFYTETGAIDYFVGQVWNIDSTDWVTISLDTFEYTNTGQVLNWRGFIFNALTMERLDRQLVSYQYENDLQVLQISSFANINSNGLVPSIRIETEYDDFGNRILNTTSIWDSFNELWISNRNDYFYYNTPIVSTDEVFDISSLEISPNPSRAQVLISLDKQIIPFEPIQIKVFNSMGQLLLQETRNAGDQLLILDIQALPNGWYNLQIQQNALLRTGKVLKI